MVARVRVQGWHCCHGHPLVPHEDICKIRQTSSKRNHHLNHDCRPLGPKRKQTMHLVVVQGTCWYDQCRVVLGKVQLVGTRVGWEPLQLLADQITSRRRKWFRRTTNYCLQESMLDLGGRIVYIRVMNGAGSGGGRTRDRRLQGSLLRQGFARMDSSGSLRRMLWKASLKGCS
jgi:hypothetical protein